MNFLFCLADFNTIYCYFLAGEDGFGQESLSGSASADFRGSHTTNPVPIHLRKVLSHRGKLRKISFDYKIFNVRLLPFFSNF